MPGESHGGGSDTSHSGGDLHALFNSAAPPPPTPKQLAHSLMLAVQSGDAQNVAQILAAHPEAANWRSGVDATMLHYAVFSNKPQIVKMLLDAGAKPEAFFSSIGLGMWSTPLYYAAERGYAECAQVLLNAGADPDMPGPGTWVMPETPLQVAQRYKHKSIIAAMHRAKGYKGISDAFEYVVGFPVSAAASPAPATQSPRPPKAQK